MRITRADKSVLSDWWFTVDRLMLVGLLLLAVMSYTLIDAFEDTELPRESIVRTSEVADSVFSTYLVPFEAVSVLLLAALVGAIVLARKD